MKGNDLHLFIREPHTPLGRLLFRSVDLMASPRRISIAMEFVPFSTQVAHLGQLRWAWLTAEISNQRAEPRTFGKVHIPVENRPSVNPLQAGQVQWFWWLMPEDIEGIEAARADSPQAPLGFKVEVEGIMEVQGQIAGAVTVTGEGHVQIPVSEWQVILDQFGYGVPPTAAALAGLASVTHPSWVDAEKRLKAARDHLRAGDGHVALTECLSQFERVAPAPYVAASWNKLVEGMPDQKTSSITALLAAHCQYLNRVGHHRGRKPPPGQDELQQMPLKQWEAELAVATSQYLLTYALRLKLETGA